MNFVEPIRDRKKIAQIKNLLRGQKRYRDLLLFVLGINTALRISDLLELQMIHFIDEQGRIRQRFWIKEKKRGKRQEVVINESIRDVLAEYLAAYPGIDEKLENFIFSTREATIMRIRSNAGRVGSLSRRSVAKWDYVAISAPTACERPGDTMRA